MAIENLFDSASSVMTVVSFTTFVGILWWTFSRSNKDFDAAANLPFADEALDYPADAGVAKEERSHV
ncbi:cbb3-type cytochrome oxidase subunit 3 [Janthinobacterium psychrotolerans]|uniref:Cytochrome c oxidase cbb3-type subunit 4 n=1 Tax=Janthinobacterium psychrotolerans TaxID=1747903 RepID=A0A1A7C5N0_9BURK|nr:cbb3-type cytochrome c oxidase subunit 3 [Janthinobacterium psychrotolerans]OBV39608.1 cytochrome c oxidase cbb3-type subunit 4 [Janthinobacterium psychrotolerans]